VGLSTVRPAPGTPGAWLAYLLDMASRPAPRDLRASDADRERVVAMLSEAAADGRLTLGEHSERTELAYAARTLGDLAELTTDLAVPADQPIRLDSRRSVNGFFGRELRDGRWVVPERLTASAIFAEVTLDLREAVLQSSRVQVLATCIGGTLRLIVPEDVAVEVISGSLVGRKGGAGAAGPGGAGAAGTGTGSPGRIGRPVIEVRAMTLAGRVKVIRPRRARWSRLRRTGQQQRR
jgi:hypothetical protein